MLGICLGAQLIIRVLGAQVGPLNGNLQKFGFTRATNERTAGLAILHAGDGFPESFMILGPNGPFTNLPPSIGTQVEWITVTVRMIEAKGLCRIEPT